MPETDEDLMEFFKKDQEQDSLSFSEKEHKERVQKIAKMLYNNIPDEPKEIEIKEQQAIAKNDPRPADYKFVLSFQDITLSSRKCFESLNIEISFLNTYLLRDEMVLELNVDYMGEYLYLFEIKHDLSEVY